MHRTGLTIVPVVPWEGARRQEAPDQLPYFYHAVLTFERQCRLKRNDDDYKRVVNFFGEKAPPEKILATRMRKELPPYVGMGPRIVNPALPMHFSLAQDNIKIPP